MNPILSIITINYNNKEGLKRTIESVLSQITENVEYIIIDGASTDGSLELIKEYVTNPVHASKLTHYISEKDTGIYNAMNKGVRLATGDYLHMLNSGDWYEQNIISQLINHLEEKDSDLVLCTVNKWLNNKKIVSEVLYPTILETGTLLHQGMFYKKNIHNLVGLYDESYKIAGDYDFCIRAFYNKNISTSYMYRPCVNFEYGGIGGTPASKIEADSIKEKYFGKPTQQNSKKKIFKYFLPYGLVMFIRNRRKGK